jgi:nucleoid-associated protein YgaU
MAHAPTPGPAQPSQVSIEPGMPVTGTLEGERSDETSAPVAAPASISGAPAATSTPAPALALASAPVTAPAGVATASRPPTTPPGQEQQEAPPPRRRPWQLFSRFFPPQTTEPAKDQRAGATAAPGANELPNANSTPAAAAEPQPVVSAAVNKSDSAVKTANWETESSSGQPPPQPQTRTKRGGVAVGPTRHTVEAGETFATISQRYYGSAAYDRALWWFNRGQVASPERLAPGNLIIIPDVKELDPAQFRSLRLKSRSTTAPEPSRLSAPVRAGGDGTKLDLPRSSTMKGEPSQVRAWPERRSEGDAPNGSSERTGGVRESRTQPIHVVRRYESLRSIARDRLGDSRRAGEIAELNQDRLGDNTPVRPGMRLILPADATPAVEAR